MPFPDRDVAAHLLAERLEPYRHDHPLVLGVPRAGVPLARVVADALGADLDVVLVHRLCMPGQPTLTFGAVDEAGVVLRNAEPPVSESDMAREVDRQRRVLRVRHHAYRDGRDPRPARGRTVIIVDDGLMTGASMCAAVQAVRRQTPARIIVAVAVATTEALARVWAVADVVVCLHDVTGPLTIRQFFEKLPPVDDDDVVELLGQSRRSGARQQAAD
jgi:putative phosphoribosyl transferase